jgi:glycyl-tRNA synthetase
MDLNDFLKNSEIVWTSASYLAGHYTYGPFGKMLKNRLEQLFRDHFDQEDFSEVETPLILSSEVVGHSGHRDNFTDPVINTCSGRQFRLDKLVEEISKRRFCDLSTDEVVAVLERLNERNPDPYLIPTSGKWQEKSLMFKTNGETYLRPETATSTYLAFNDLYQISCNRTLPVKVFQIGRAFRDEINPKHGILRSKEFTQIEAQVILDEASELEIDWQRVLSTRIRHFDGESYSRVELGELLKRGTVKSKNYCYTFYLIESWIGRFFPPERVRYIQHSNAEKAFYSLESWDLEIDLDDYGWYEVCGLHHRGRYDLTQQNRYSAVACQPVPQVLELAIGLDRVLYSLVVCHYQAKSRDSGKRIFQLPFQLAPIQVAVLPLLKNRPELVARAKEVYRELKPGFKAAYFDRHSIGRRYMTCAVKAIPFCVTVDFDTVKDLTVTVRHRDTEEQQRVSLGSELQQYLHSHLRGSD